MFSMGVYLCSLLESVDESRDFKRLCYVVWRDDETPFMCCLCFFGKDDFFNFV
jgi:hypothetical protein